jgi:hypothetical protein
VAPNPEGSRIKRVLLPTLMVAALAVTASGCASFEEPDDVVYCVDDSNTVVDDTKCNDPAVTSSTGNPAFWYLIGRFSGGLPLGSQLDPALTTNKVPVNNSSARTAAGLSPTGKVSTGTSISGKGAGFGSGTGKGGGFGGGHSGG